ncbi:hypothetical protein BASA81_004465 [Batrachochytrium salamandrivorans]|nr:hypothetical protein BASA81_004465 [Batrachochytrium salamandrivorans]
MFRAFRRGSRSVRFDEGREVDGGKDGGQEEEDEAKRMIRRPSLARRLSSTLLGRKLRSSSAGKQEGEEGEEEVEEGVLLTWGRDDLHQLLRDGRMQQQDDDQPTHEFSTRPIPNLQSVALGLFHSVAITPTSVYGSGDNAEGQLDSSQEPFLGAKKIQFTSESIAPTQASVGLNHTCLLTEGGMVLTWGSNEMGQLGRKLSASTAVQQVDGAMRKERAIQVQCTENATIVLTERGQVWSFGESTRGELGRPDCVDFYLASPVRGGLYCNPITLVACGAGHVVCLTQSSGRPIGWGWNRYGQLGFEPASANKRCESEPVSLPFPPNLVIRHVDCGSQHTAMQTVDGKVYTAGSNDLGQLARLTMGFGFHEIDLEVEVAKVACGAFHTLFLTKTGKIVGTGSSEFGEVLVLSENDEAKFDWGRIPATDVFAGGNASACVVGGRKQRGHYNTNRIKTTLDCQTLREIAQQAVASGSLGELKGAIVGEFHCTGLNRSFFFPSTASKVDATQLVSCLELVTKALAKSKDGERFFQTQQTALFQDLYLLAPVATQPDQLRCFFVALIHPANLVPALLPTHLFVQLIRALAELQPKLLQTVIQWLFVDLGADFVNRQVLQLLVRNADFCVERRDWGRSSGCMPQTIRLIRAIYQTNSNRGGKIPPQSFYLKQPDVWPQATLMEEWSIYNKNKLLDPDVYFSLFNYSVVLSAETKWNVLMYDSQSNQMSTAVSAAVNRTGTPFLEITIDRGNLLQDALRVLSECKQSDLSKPLRVTFANEPGLDWGGVRKEFFELLGAVLFKQDSFRGVDNNALWLNPNGTNARLLKNLRPALGRRNPHFTPQVLCVDSYQCFSKCGELKLLKDEEGSASVLLPCSVCGFTRPCAKSCARCKFNVCAECVAAEQGLEREMTIHHQLVLTGALMGLAVYNSTLLDVRFPVLLYAALLGKQQDMVLEVADLTKIDAQLGKSMQYVLDFEGEEQTFQDLFEGAFGDDEHVTMQTKADYVRRRIRFELRDGVRDILLPIKQGFESVLDVSRNNAMQLLTPAELEMMIIGVSELNFADLRAHCKYEGGYTETTKVIKWFWEVVVDELSEEDKRLLLTFTTGSSHAPMGGLRKQNFLVQRAGPDSDQLPTSSTCFETLLLPEYSSKKKLKAKLTVALRNAQGFGLQ